MFIVFKIHIFLEGHKILRNLHRRFDRYYIDCYYMGDKFKLEILQNFVSLSEYMNFNKNIS